MYKEKQDIPNLIGLIQIQFNSFMDTIDGINPKSLTARLQELERNDVIERKIYLEVPSRVEYSLSEK